MHAYTGLQDACKLGIRQQHRSTTTINYQHVSSKHAQLKVLALHIHMQTAVQQQRSNPSSRRNSAVHWVTHCPAG
jgi:hypothetical protein